MLPHAAEFASGRSVMHYSKPQHNGRVRSRLYCLIILTIQPQSALPAPTESVKDRGVDPTCRKRVSPKIYVLCTRKGRSTDPRILQGRRCSNAAGLGLRDGP